MSSDNTTPNLATVTLTAVPAAHPAFTSRRVNWQDQSEVHRAVMSLFAAELPGPDGAKRSSSTILYRLETPPTGARVLIQSSNTATRTDEGIASTTLAGIANVLVPGAAIRLRIDVNAVRTQSRTGKRLPVPMEGIAEFLLNEGDLDRPGLFAAALHSLTVIDVTSAVRAAGRVPLRVASITGEAIVADPQALIGKLIHGVGRGKSYGCGLLTVAPA